jgi:hypothetical protein
MCGKTCSEVLIFPLSSPEIIRGEDKDKLQPYYHCSHFDTWNNPYNFLDGLRKTAENVRISGVLVEAPTDDLQNTSPRALSLPEPTRYRSYYTKFKQNLFIMIYAWNHSNGQSETQ